MLSAIRRRPVTGFNPGSHRLRQRSARGPATPPPMPERCDASIATVTPANAESTSEGSSANASAIGMSHRMSPFSTAKATSVAVIDFVQEPMCQRSPVSIAAVDPILRRPAAHSCVAPALSLAAASPGSPKRSRISAIRRAVSSFAPAHVLAPAPPIAAAAAPITKRRDMFRLVFPSGIGILPFPRSMAALALRRFCDDRDPSGSRRSPPRQSAAQKRLGQGRPYRSGATDSAKGRASIGRD
jgi:hypothetical protein